MRDYVYWIDKEKVFEALDPDEEAEFSKQLDPIERGVINIE